MALFDGVGCWYFKCVEKLGFNCGFDGLVLCALPYTGDLDCGVITGGG